MKINVICIHTFIYNYKNKVIHYHAISLFSLSLSHFLSFYKMSVLRQQQSHFTTSQHSIQQAPKNDEPIASYLAELNKRSKRNTFDGSYNKLQKRKSSGVIDKIMSKKSQI